ncbi:unnamed protein product (plasmid) [Mycetohabitans rhizoxinica HKI 454]|uniref:Uncharacterized protein n=1 Tax=Mycetohabitans rhizoxinica (strain DSM 19002 / CIP 109453 / HKI 454) TaxID=882378 RepID=E5AW60_MYCRK|nr:unnamed protein product [Mycetohabitans rhizoxinica HKI 454]
MKTITLSTPSSSERIAFRGEPIMCQMDDLRQ